MYEIVFYHKLFLEDKMKKIASVVLIGFVFVLLAGCIVGHPRIAPPPLKKEIRSVKPGPNHVWISGHWKKKGPRYVWVPGHWRQEDSSSLSSLFSLEKIGSLLFSA
jgi:hypothetical protein